MSTTPTKYEHLEPRLGSAYRQLFLKGLRVRAEIPYHLSRNPKAPMTPEEIAAEYGWPLEAIREAIAYCESNPPELISDRLQEEALYEATGMNDPNYDGRPRPISPEERARINRL
jgi:uncharacterized protein (DUF433 family)